jgi:uroporphyrinogen decarboxylase
MTGRERVLATINREPIDRLPIDFSATAMMQDRLIRDLNTGTAANLHKRLGVDISEVAPSPKPGPFGGYYGHTFTRQVDEGRFVDNWGITWQRSEVKSGDVFYDVVGSPLSVAETVGEVDDFPWPDPADDWDFTTIKRQAEACGDLAVCAASHAVFDDAWRMRELARFMMDLAINPEIAHALLRKVCDYWLTYARLLLESGGGRIDLMWTKDDLGTQNGLFISPDACREFVMPLIRERVDLFKRYGAKAMMHSCGGIYPVIRDIVECGVDVLNPIQPKAHGMDRRKIKAEFGDRLCFHGSVDQQSILVFGSVQDVIAETRECLAVLGAGGGYMVAPSHAFETDIPTENVVAMYDTALEWKVK